VNITKISLKKTGACISYHPCVWGETGFMWRLYRENNGAIIFLVQKERIILKVFNSFGIHVSLCLFWSQ